MDWDQLDGVVVDVNRAIRRFRFLASAAPLAFDDPALLPAPGLDQFCEDAELSARAYPQLAALLRETVDSMCSLLGVSTAPLLDPVVRSYQTGGESVAILCKANTLSDPIRATLSEHAQNGSIRIVSDAELRRSVPFDRIVVVGRTSWFSEHVFAAPKAPQIEVVAYEWILDKWIPDPVFLQTEDPALPGGTIRRRARVAPVDEDLWPEVEWEHLTPGFLLAPGVGNAPEAGHDLVEARLAVLSGQKAVFLEATEGSTSLVIDALIEGDEIEIARARNTELLPCMFVLLRTEGGGDYVATVADRILGPRASELRARQTEWKSRLRAEVRDSSIETRRNNTSRIGIASSE